MKHRLARREGIREIDPLPGKQLGPIMVTHRISATIRRTVGWILPLEAYNESDRPLLEKYVERLVALGATTPADFDLVASILREARNRLGDQEYEDLLTYASLVLTSRLGIPSEV